MVVINSAALLLSILYYFKYSDLYESRVNDMRNMYLGMVADMLTKETEIDNVFLFCKILIAFFFINLSASIFLFLRIRKIEEKQ
jgi:hypothetical protein